MARDCPSCGRRNADAAARCLYCVAPLPPVEDPGSGEPPSAAAPSVSASRHLLVLLPGESPDEAAVQELARIAEGSLYDARLSLSSRRPRLFRRIEREEEARRISEELTRARIPHYVVAESSVLSLPIAAVAGIDFRERHLELRLGGPNASLFPVAYPEILLLVRGEITRERHDEKRLGSPRGASRRLTPSLRLHLYPREAATAFEIDPERFDFRALDGGATASVLLNLERLVSSLRTRAPGAALDRGFDQEPPVLSRSTGEGELTDALSSSERGPEGVIYDDEASFRFYARWRYRVERHLTRRLESGG